MLSFKKHRLELSKCIQYPMLLYCRLQSAGLLPHDRGMKKSDIALTKLGVSELLDAIEGIINSDPENFYKFVDVLEKDSTMWPISNKLWCTGEHSLVFWCNSNHHVHANNVCMIEYNIIMHMDMHLCVSLYYSTTDHTTNLLLLLLLLLLHHPLLPLFFLILLFSLKHSR